MQTENNTEGFLGGAKKYRFNPPAGWKRISDELIKAQVPDKSIEAYSLTGDLTLPFLSIGVDDSGKQGIDYYLRAMPFKDDSIEKIKRDLADPLKKKVIFNMTRPEQAEDGLVMSMFATHLASFGSVYLQLQFDFDKDYDNLVPNGFATTMLGSLDVDEQYEYRP